MADKHDPEDYSVEKYGILNLFEDKSFTRSNLEMMHRFIVRDLNTPADAAKRIGVGKKKFERWMQNEDFNNFIELMVAERDGEVMSTMGRSMRALEEDQDHSKVLDGAIKIMERIKPEFGKKQIAIENTSKVERPEYDFDDVLKEAEEHANRDTDDS